MNKQKRLLLNDVNIQAHFGSLVVNVLNINYEPPVPMRYFNTHKHNSYEFHFIPQGKGNLRIGKTNYEITPGTFYLTGPDIYHEQVSDNEEPMVEYCINLELIHLDKWNENSYPYPAQEIIGINELLTSTTFWMGEDTYSSWKLIQKILDEYHLPMLGYCMYMESLIIQLVINIVRCYQGDKKVSYTKTFDSLSQNRRKIMDSFFREYHKPLKPEALAASLGVSRRQVDRLMIQYYGMSFKDFIMKTRIEIAKDLLQNTNMTIEEIASKIGFLSSSHFSRVFNTYEGISPSAYKKDAMDKLVL